MKVTLLLFILIVSAISGCGSSSSSEPNDYKQPLLGTWRATNTDQDQYIILSEDKFQKLTEHASLTCFAVQIESGFQVNGRSLILEETVGISDYQLTQNQLTLINEDTTTTHYQLVTDAQLVTCNPVEFQKRWKLVNDDRTSYLDFSQGKLKFYSDIDGATCLVEQPENYQAHENLITMTRLHESWQGTYSIEAEQLTINWHNLTFYNGESVNPELQSTFIEDSGEIEYCHDTDLTKKIIVKIGFKTLPELLENYVPDTTANNFFLRIGILFDIDNDGTQSTGDLKFLLDNEYSENMFQSSWQSLGGRILFTKRISSNTLIQAEVAKLDIRVEGNFLILIAKASYFKLLDAINNGTAINVNAYLGSSELHQSDTYPNNIAGNNNEQYTTGADNSYLEDDMNDVRLTGESTILPLVEIQTIEVIILE